LVCTSPAACTSAPTFGLSGSAVSISVMPERADTKERVELIAVIGTATATEMEVTLMEEGRMELVPVTRMIIEPMGDWKTVIRRLVGVRDELAGGILRYRWATGKLAMAVSEERSKPEGERRFPGHTIQDVAVELGESDSTVYDSMKFAAQTTPDQLEHLIEKRWAWRAAAALVTVDDPKVRRRLQLDHEDKKYGNSDGFKEAVREANEEATLGRSKKKAEKSKKATTSGGGRYIRTWIERLNTVGGTFRKDTIPEFIRGLKKFRAQGADLAPVTAENLVALIATAKDNIDLLLKLLGDARVAIDKLGVLGAGAKAKSED